MPEGKKKCRAMITMFWNRYSVYRKKYYLNLKIILSIILPK